MSEADIKGIPDDDPGPDESAVSPTEIEKVDKHTAERPKLCRWCTSPISSSATVCATCKGNQVWFWYYFDKLLLSVSTGVSIILVAIAWINVNLTEQNLNEAREALSIAQSAAKEALRAKTLASEAQSMLDAISHCWLMSTSLSSAHLTMSKN